MNVVLPAGAPRLNVQAMRNLQRALRESPDPEMFTMKCYAHECGTPACVFGHYADRTDLQDAFVLRLETSGFVAVYLTGTDDRAFYAEDAVMQHFGITEEEAFELFAESAHDGRRTTPAGCNGAKTAEEAIEYIEKFIQRHAA